MGAGKRLVRFGSGSVLGAGIGAAAAILFAPQSGDEMTGRFLDRIRQARLAGAEAKAAKEDELIRKFRAGVNDPGALQKEETKARLEAAEAVNAVAAAGLGLNAPGALAAQEAALRAAAPAAPDPAPAVPPLPADVRAPEVVAVPEMAAGGPAFPEDTGGRDSAR